MTVLARRNSGFWALIAAAAVIGALVAFLGVQVVKRRSDALEREFLSNKSLDKSLWLASQLYDAENKRIGEYSTEKRYYISLDELPKHVVQAFLAAEDADFYEHGGVSYTGIARAAFANMRARTIVQGASTITQQLARIFFLNSQKTARRKFDEIALAYALERNLSKDRILELYLNKIFLGNHSHGVESAARNYFRKSASDLDVAEAALLAGIVAAPTKYAPHRYFRKAKTRQIYVVDQMVRKGFLQVQDAQRWLRHGLRIAKNPLGNNETAPHFVNAIRKQLEDTLSIPHLNEAGLRIETTLDMQFQNTMRREIPGLLNATFGSFGTPPPQEVQAAVLAMDMQTGRVLAMQGSKDYERSQFDRVMSARRPLGSAFMPFYFSLAMDRGFNLLSSIYEEKKTVTPHIDEPLRRDDLSIFEALLFARAPESARLFSWLGIGTVIDASKDWGFQFEQNDLALALGIGKATPMELLSASTIFVNKGTMKPAYFVERVLDRDKNVLFKHEPFGANERPISEEAAFMIYDTLVNAGRYGAAQTSKTLQGRFATIVGTDEALHDAWFVGFNQGVGVLVWVGSEFGKQRLALNETILRGKITSLWTNLVQRLPIRDANDALSHAAPEGISYTKLPAEAKGPVAFVPVKLGLEPL